MTRRIRRFLCQSSADSQGQVLQTTTRLLQLPCHTSALALLRNQEAWSLPAGQQRIFPTGQRWILPAGRRWILLCSGQEGDSSCYKRWMLGFPAMLQQTRRLHL